MLKRFLFTDKQQKLKTQIRLLLQEKYDQSLHCVPFFLHLLYSKANLLECRVISENLRLNRMKKKNATFIQACGSIYYMSTVTFIIALSKTHKKHDQ